MDKGGITQEWSDAGVTHLSASQLGRTEAKWVFDYLYLDSSERRKMGVGERAAIGTAVHSAVQSVLCAGNDIDESISRAQTDFDFHPADQDKVLRDKFRTCIPAMVNNGLDLLGEAFTGATEEKRIEIWLDGVGVPIIGFVDLLQDGTMFCEMKTKAPRKTKILKSGEQGWSRATLPKKPEYSHLCQSAIYQKALGVTPSIAYIAEHDAVLFTPFNCESLSGQSIADCLEDIRQKALRRQNLLKISNDPKVLASFIEPDWQHAYQWKMEPEFYRKARELWQQ